MSGRVIKVAYGQYKEGYGFGRSNSVTDRCHLVELAPYNTLAVCGVGTGGATEFITGVLCPRCARLLDIATAEDLEVDQETYEWMAAQRRSD